GAGARLQHPQVHTPPNLGRPAAAAGGARQHRRRQGFVGRCEKPRRIPRRSPAVVSLCRLGLALVCRSGAGLRRGHPRRGRLRRRARRPGVRRLPRRRSGGRGEAAGAARSARPRGRGEARPRGMEGGHGRRGRGPARRAGAPAARARRGVGPGAGGEARRRVTDYRALLAAIAVPRRSATAANKRVRDVLKRELAARGFVVMEHGFTGRSLLHRYGRAPLEGVNLIGVRPRARVSVWLAAHYDSKGQPLSMATRLAAAGLATLGALELVALAARAWLGPLHAGVPDVGIGAAGPAGILALAANRVTDHSAGAVDNAAGVVAVLATVDALPRDAGVGVLFPDAEEYGLLGARALGRERANLLGDTCIVNFDGIDDRGGTIAFVHRAGPTIDRVATALGARRARWLPVLVDGLVLTRAAREGVTIMRGEGHGKIVGGLAERADLVVRYQGGANAGHTVHTGAGEFVLHQIPSGIIQGAVCLVGNGVVLDPETLFTELDALSERGIRTEHK